METLFFDKVRDLKKELNNLQERLNVALTLKGKQLIIEGEAYSEYEAAHVLEAVQFGFSIKKALLLLDEDNIFRSIPIKSFTRRKYLHEVRARIIGKEGKTKRALENISNCEILVREKDNQVGIIGSAINIHGATTALTNLIRGSKQANVYAFLERLNAIKKDKDKDLGLKIKNN